MVQLTWEKNTDGENCRYLTPETVSEKQKVERNNVRLTKKGNKISPYPLTRNLIIVPLLITCSLSERLTNLPPSLFCPKVKI